MDCISTNAAVGLGPDDRLFVRQLEVEGHRLVVKYWRDLDAEGEIETHGHFIRPLKENAA